MERNVCWEDNILVSSFLCLQWVRKTHLTGPQSVSEVINCFRGTQYRFTENFCLLFVDTKRQGNEERRVRKYEDLQFDTYRTQIYIERA
jgi:hypothetical protein